MIFIRRLVKDLVLAVTYSLFGSTIALVGLYVYMIESRPDLKIWHLAELERRLFQQLEERVYAGVGDADRRRINRFSSGSVTDPTAYPHNWNGVRGFYRTLAYQSVVDATVLPATVIDNLFTNLAAEGHQLVLFDVNRNTQAERLLKSDPETLTERLFSEEALRFDLTLISNASGDTNAVVARRKPALAQHSYDVSLDLC